MDESLFKRLSEHHPSAVVSLQYQYRMNKDIMALANVVIYDQRMRCGTTAVANELLEMPKLETINQPMEHNRKQGENKTYYLFENERRILLAKVYELIRPFRHRETRNDW